jgi:hypothetical protein
MIIEQKSTVVEFGLGETKEVKIIDFFNHVQEMGGTFEILTPNGFVVANLHLRIWSRRTSGYIEPAPISPKPPALLTAAANSQPLHQIIPA